MDAFLDVFLNASGFLIPDNKISQSCCLCLSLVLCIGLIVVIIITSFKSPPKPAVNNQPKRASDDPHEDVSTTPPLYPSSQVQPTPRLESRTM